MDTFSEELLASLRKRIGNGAIPASDGDLDRAEGKLEQSLPSDLRQIYQLADGRWGPGNGFFPLASAVTNYLSLISDPFGPLGELWPASLFPLYEEDQVPVCYEFATGRIIAWEADRIEDTERDGAFAASFIEEAPSLSELLSRWLEAESIDEMRERLWRETFERADKRGLSPVTGLPIQFDDLHEQVENEIAFLEHAPDLRDHSGLPKVGWQAEVRRRYGLARRS